MTSIRNLFCIIIFCTSILIIIYFLNVSYGNNRYNSSLTTQVPAKSIQSRFDVSNNNEIIIAIVACGDKLSEAYVLIKSAIVFQMKNSLKFIVFTEDHLFQNANETLTKWQRQRNGTFQFEIHHIQFPKNKEKLWKNLFKKCACQRLFLPNLLSEVDSILYMDTDTLFLGPIEDVWKHFNLMNSTQMVALTIENEDRNNGWYSRFAKHPFYGETGVNSGVMLMNLTQMRNFGWEQYLEPIYKQYKTNIIWGDQDIINIIFHYYPDKLYIYPCRLNFRSDHCMYMSVCKSATDQGVLVLHGSRSLFHSNKEPSFSAIFQAFKNYEFNTDLHEYLLTPLKLYLEDTITTNCGSNYNMFLKNLKQMIQPLAL